MVLLDLLSDKKGLFVYGKTRSLRDNKYRHFNNKNGGIYPHGCYESNQKQQGPSYLTTTLVHTVIPYNLLLNSTFLTFFKNLITALHGGCEVASRKNKNAKKTTYWGL